MSNRRIFLKNLSHLAVASAMGATITARAQAAKVDEKDPQAIALGYNHDSSKVDKAKYPNHLAVQQCNNCMLYQGKAGDATGACPLFAGKVVSANGWCSAYSKKA
ncbi:high-potential iron-sulfur protein [Glaciimonas sp. GG7]